MTWFKVDDNLAFHQKALRAGNPAMGMWVRAGSWCAHQLTDGFIPDEMVGTLGGVALARKLVAAGLWIPADGGFMFHQWGERQPTREQVERDRKAALLRKERWKERRGNAVPDNVPSPSGTGTPTRPDPTRPIEEEPRSFPSAKAEGPSEPKPPDRFDEFWSVYPKKVAKDAAKRRFATLTKRGIDPAEIIDGARRYAATRRGEDPQFTKQPDGWLNAGRWSDELATVPQRREGWEYT